MRSLSLTLGTLVVAVVAAAPSKATFPGDDGRIAFRRYLDKAQTRGAIFTVARDGTGERQLTRPASGVVDDQPDWSPDGSRLVFTRCLRNSACAAYTVRADGSGLAKVSPACRPASRCGGDQSAAFAPDGRRVAFSRFDTRYGCCAIVTTDLRGGHLTVVTKGRKPYAIGEPQFSPDGKRIAYAEVAQPRERPRAIFVVNVDGTGRHRVTPWSLNAGDNPDWSPDGTTIVFRSNVQVPGAQSQLYTVRSDGSGLRRLTDLESGAIVTSASFSPSGTSIVFATTGLGGNADLFAVNVDGSNLRQITRTELWDSAPDWGTGR